MFTIRSTYRFTTIVEARLPDGQTESFEATFEAGAEILDGLQDPARAMEALRTALVGFGDIVDSDGQPVIFSESARDRLLDLPFIAKALVKALSDGFWARRGNA
jgi:hypothetical protein